MTDQTTENEADQLLTLAEVAVHLDVSIRTVQRYVAEGLLPVTWLLPKHRRPRIRREDLDALVDNGAA
jgi:excisionase family DNA binding protein